MYYSHHDIWKFTHLFISLQAKSDNYETNNSYFISFMRLYKFDGARKILYCQGQQDRHDSGR